MSGRWALGPDHAEYLGPLRSHDWPYSAGMALSPYRLSDGWVRVKATLSTAAGDDPSARIVFGYDPATSEYYSVGVGGFATAYVIHQYSKASGWQAVRRAGSHQSLQRDRAYVVRLDITGQHSRVTVDEVPVLEYELPEPFRGGQLGLFARGDGSVRFEEFATETAAPTAFVAIQFGQPYDALYRDVIRPVAEEAGFDVHRADEIYRPGVILQDIIERIRTASVIVAEITPPNPNVFYELGYAQAVGRPIILLADRKVDKLPFDVSGFRVIFYDDSIGGKSDVERQLRLHLAGLSGLAAEPRSR
jgi:hypothetical protein